MLQILGVSRSGYYAWKDRKSSKSQERKKDIKAQILKVYNDSHQNYGAPKITKILVEKGEVISERTVGKYMREMGIKAQWVSPWTVTTIDSDFSSELQNVLQREFNPDRPNAIWCTDITYIWTTNGFVYLSCVMDLFSRKIISWSLSKTLKVSGVLEAINKAKSRRNSDLPIIIHSDRGSQYVSKDYKDATTKMTRSYSKKGDPWDNACIESFHALIKREWLNRQKIKNYNHAYRLVFGYIETFYNTTRTHSHCNYMSPNDYEKMYTKSQIKGYKFAS